MSNHNKETKARCFHCYRHYVEGTAAWALYMMRMGRKVTNPKYDPRVYHLPEGGMIHVNGIESIAGNQWIDYWCIDIPDGWEIYEEPKPLLADAKVGDLCKTDLDEWIQIDDAPEPPSPILYHFDRPFKGNIIHTEPLAPEGSAEWAWQMMKLGKTISRTDNRKETYVYQDGKIVANEWHRADQQWFLKYAEPAGWQLYEGPAKEPKPPKEPDHIICKGCGGSQSVPKPAVSNTAYTTCPKCGGTGYEIREQKPDDLYLNIKPSNPADWCLDKKNLLVLVDDNFKGIVGENVTREQVGEIAKLLTEPAKEQFEVGDWVEYRLDSRIYYGEINDIRDHAYYLSFTTEDIPPDQARAIRLENIIRKLNPLDVVVHIGGLKGTVRRSSSSHFCIICGDHWSMIAFAMLLDTATRELVESLLKAQEGE